MGGKETDDLVNAMNECFKNDIFPDLPDNLKYTGLMMRKALSILSREIESQNTLQDRSNPVEKIRNRCFKSKIDHISDLMTPVRQELLINSPGFLKEIDYQVDSIGLRNWVFNPEKLAEEDRKNE